MIVVLPTGHRDYVDLDVIFSLYCSAHPAVNREQLELLLDRICEGE